MAENQNDTQTTVIGADSYFKGELEFDKTARIIGRFDGKITGKGELQVTQSAALKADVESAVANIDGSVEGNITAKDGVKLNANGKVRGDITATKMVMAEGASFYGMCAVGPDAGRSGGGNAGGGGNAPQQGGGNQGGGNQGGNQPPQQKK